MPTTQQTKSSFRPERSEVEKPASLPLHLRVLPGIEVDILADGTLDLDDATLAQMDIVVASVHSHFNQSIEEMTTRVLRALENPYVRILGHPTGRKVLNREAYAINIDLIQTIRLQNRRRHRRSLHRRARPDALRHHPAPPRLAHPGRHPQHRTHRRSPSPKPPPQTVNKPLLKATAAAPATASSRD